MNKLKIKKDDTVMLVCPRCNKPTRVGYGFETDGKGAVKKFRVCKKCAKKID